MRAVIYTDGASSGNPGNSGLGAVISLNGKTHEIAENIGIATNNIAEYSSLVRALECALELGVKEAEVYMDSELVVKQMLGQYKVKNEGLKPLYKKASALSGRFSAFSIKHVPREQNTHADKLSKKALDLKPAHDAANSSAQGQGSLPFQ
jgi:ribonuclease HI